MNNNLKKLRESRNINQKQLAALINSSPSQVNGWENGKRRLSDVWIGRLAVALDYPPSAFLSDGTTGAPTDNTGFDKAKFMDTWRRAQSVLRQRAADFDETTLDAFMEQAADYAHLPEPEFEEKLGTILNAMLALSSRRKVEAQGVKENKVKKGK